MCRGHKQVGTSPSNISGAIHPSVPAIPDLWEKLIRPSLSFLQRPKSEIIALTWTTVIQQLTRRVGVEVGIEKSSVEIYVEVSVYVEVYVSVRVDVLVDAYV